MNLRNNYHCGINEHSKVALHDSGCQMKQVEDQLDLFANADEEEEPDQHKEGKEDTKNKKHSRSMLIVLLPDECHEDD